MRAIALDIGQKRVGVAYADTAHGVALPLKVVALADVEGMAAPFKTILEDYDERLSSTQAKRILHEQGLTERQMRGKLDCIAASLFLQTWIDRRAHETMGDS